MGAHSPARKERKKEKKKERKKKKKERRKKEEKEKKKKKRKKKKEIHLPRVCTVMQPHHFKRQFKLLPTNSAEV